MSNGPVIEGKTIVDGKTMSYGECIFCHQMYSFETLDIPVTDEIIDSLNRRATEVCSCDDAKEWKKKIAKRERAMENIEAMFEKDHPEVSEILKGSVDALMEYRIDKIKIDIGGGVVADMALSKNDNVIVNRTVTVKKTLEN